MNKKLVFGVLFFSVTTVATLALGMVFLQKIYMVTLKKTIVFGIVASFIAGAMAGTYLYRRRKGCSYVDS